MKKYLLIIVLMVGLSEVRADTIPKSPNHDFITLYAIQQQRTPTLNRHWLAVSNSLALSPAPALGHCVYGLAANDKAALYNAAELGGSWLLTAGVTMTLKWIVNRPRPYTSYPSDLVCLQPLVDPSFPSGHTSLCFATATTLSLFYPRWYVVVPAFAWAIGVGYSRLYVGAHYPTDVVVGAMVGIGSAVVAHWVRNNIDSHHPDIVPVMLPVTLTF